jgi:hypothetical protein
MMLFIHLFVPVSVFSQDRQEISTDRPDQSTTPELVVKGALQIESGFLFSRTGDARSAEECTTYNSTVLGENASITYNFLVLEDPLSDKLRTRYTIAYEQSINERMAFFLESYGSFSLILKEHSFDGGFTYRFSSIIQFDISAGINPCYPAKNFFVGSGVSFRCFQ